MAAVQIVNETVLSSAADWKRDEGHPPRHPILDSVEVAVLLLLAACYLLFTYRWKNLSIFRQLNVPGPRPNLLFGNLLHFLNTPMYKKLWQWEREYGKVFGIFEGPTPVMVVSDRQLLQEIFVRKFPKFNAKKIFPLQWNPDTHTDIHMFLASGKRSRRFRQVMSVIFCQEQTLRVYQRLQGICHNLVGRLEWRIQQENSRDGFNIYEDTQRLTCDFICQWALGLDVNSLKEDGDAFFKDLYTFFKNMVYFKKVPVIGAIIFPELNDFFRWCLIKMVELGLTPDPMGVLINKITEIITDYEKKEKEGSIDNTQTTENVLHMLKLQQVDLPEGKIPYEMERGVLRSEIIQQLLLMIMAGFETSSTMIALACYELARHPDIQQELRDALVPRVSSVADASLEDLASVPYLSWVVQETSRLYPTASPVLTRRCLETVKIGDLTIPKGMNITPNTWAMHYDPEVWGPEDPHTFCPARFHPDRMSERPPLTQVLSFGLGPRSCIGRQIGLIETKLAIAAIVSRFRIVHCPQHDPIRMREAASITPDQVMVRLEPL